jgi:chemotaxis protein MotB
LSAERANSARRALILGGAADSAIDEIRGYADRRLRDRNDPLGAVNRRISVIVRYSRDQTGGDSPQPR